LHWLIITLVKTVDDFKRWVTLVWHGISLRTFGIAITKSTGIA
jgi:hypothetical protein